ncbi:MAG: SGNH/GDSL hydrolase family protein [Pseudomonadota bacterium]
MPNQVFIFGDSLSDVDVIFSALVEALTAQILPGLIAGLGPDPTPEQIEAAAQQAALLAEQAALAEAQALGFGPENAVTNEFTHAVYFEDLSGTEVVNLANAGARALGTQEPFGPGTGYDSNLGAQLQRFLSVPVEPDAQAILYIGSNDFSDIVGSAVADPDASIFDIIGATTGAIEAVLASLEGAARTLDAAGVEEIFFGSLPGATFFPSSDVLDDVAAGLSDAAVSIYNGFLAELAEDLQDDGIEAEIIDYAAVANAFTEDPSGFGVVAERSDFLVDGSAFDSDQVGFWDPIHPAEAVHQAWGAYAAFVMEGGSTASLSDFGTPNFQSNGANAVFANGGDDVVFARGGDDIVFGGTGSDTVLASRGDDIVSGGTGDDSLFGHGDDDLIDGGDGDDGIFGGSGNDVLIDGLGSDFVRGGRGDDAFLFVEGVLEGDASATEDSLNGGLGDDTLYLVLSDATFDAFEADGASATLAALGITTSNIESVVAIDGCAQVESALGGFSWFQEGDYWGLLPAPTPDVIA